MKILKNRLGKDIPYKIQKDFPIEGVEYIDLMPIVMDKDFFEMIIDHLAHVASNYNIDYIMSPEARGFIYAIPISRKLNVEFIPCKKFGKLDEKQVAKQFTYNKEYGLDKLEIPIIDPNDKDYGYKGKTFYLIDDIYATGNTVNAIKKAIEELGGNVVGIGVILNYVNLNNDDVYSILDVSD